MPTSKNSIETLLRDASALRFTTPDTAERASARTVASHAVERAVALRKLERASQSTGFRSMPLPQHLTRLARTAGVEKLLPPLPSNGHGIAPWIKLAHSIRSDIHHLQLWIRGWFLTLVTGDPVEGPLAAARSGGAHGNVPIPEDLGPEAFAARLAAVESAYPPGRKKELAAWLNS